MPGQGKVVIMCISYRGKSRLAILGNFFMVLKLTGSRSRDESHVSSDLRQCPLHSPGCPLTSLVSIIRYAAHKQRPLRDWRAQESLYDSPYILKYSCCKFALQLKSAKFYGRVDLFLGWWKRYFSLKSLPSSHLPLKKPNAKKESFTRFEGNTCPPFPGGNWKFSKHGNAINLLTIC